MASPSVGKRLGEWTLLAELGRGGQGAVFRAEHARTRAPAAVKVLHDPGGAAGARFAQEARVLEALRHPGVVRALGHGVDGGVAWLALELVVGSSLLELAGRGRLAFDRSARVVGDVALALAHCHARGVLHRDLKPENVLIEGATGRAVLVDFGLVKRDPTRLHLSSLDDGRGAAALSVTGEVRGTPAYMAPEQVNPDAFGPEGPRTDVHGLGGLLFFLLTGEPPAGIGAPPVLLRRVTRRPARDPRELDPAVPAGLAELCLACLQKEPARRPPDPAAVAAALGMAPTTQTPPPTETAETRLDAEVAPAAAPHAPGRPPRPGELFAGHRVVRELGRGAFGLVVEATRPDGTPCALKVLLRGADDDAARERFLREAQACRAVTHPGLVRALDHGQEGQAAWLALELVRGARPLDRWVADLEPTLEERLAVFRGVLDAVGAAHEAGLVHRDLKPQNVLVDEAGAPRVVDLGVARHLEKERLTLSGAAVGTPAYMAPEQVLGRGGVDARADVWALGVLLHELVSGERPFEGGTPFEVMAAILEDEPRDLLADAPRAPPALAAVVRRALARRPEERFASTTAFASALDAALAPPVASARARWPRWLAGAALLAPLGLVVVSGLRELRARRAWEVAREDVLARRGEVDALLRASAPLATDAAAIGSLCAAVREALRTPSSGQDVELGVALGELNALEGLLSLASGDVAAATSARAMSSHALPVAAATRALRAALDARDEQADAARAIAELTFALEHGVGRVDLRSWRAGARARLLRGRPSRLDAELLAADLDAVAAARALAPDEQVWRAEALLALDRAEDAAAALAAADEAALAGGAPSPVPPGLRWAVALARAAPHIDAAPARASALLRPLPAPAPAAAAPARERALRALGRLTSSPDAPLALLADHVELAALVGATPGEGLRAALLRRGVTVDASKLDDRVRFVLAIAALSPGDLATQREAGRLAQWAIGVEDRRALLGPLERAIALAPDDAGRLEDELLLCAQRGELSTLRADLDGTAAFSREDAAACFALAERLLGREDLSLDARARTLTARGCARRALGDPAAAVVDLEAARAIGERHLLNLWRGLALRELGRLDDAQDALLQALRDTLEANNLVDRALILTWEIGRRTGRLEPARQAIERALVLRPTLGGWRLRLAALRRALGLPWEGARDDAARDLEASGDESLRALGAQVRRVGQGSLDPLVERVEALRGTGCFP